MLNIKRKITVLHKMPSSFLNRRSDVRIISRPPYLQGFHSFVTIHFLPFLAYFCPLIGRKLAECISLVILISVTGCATDRIYSINERINQYRYIPDTVNYMKTPAEFYRDGGGDCEDFANAKKAALAEAGYTNLNFVLITAEKTTGQPHMVLEAEGWILDNMTNDLIPASSIQGFRVNQAQAIIISKGVTAYGK